jgi:hypothetical protein
MLYENRPVVGPVGDQSNHSGQQPTRAKQRYKGFQPLLVFETNNHENPKQILMEKLILQAKDIFGQVMRNHFCLHPSMSAVSHPKYPLHSPPT